MHPERGIEQRHFDEAYERREQIRASMASRPVNVRDGESGAAVNRHAPKQAAALQPTDAAVAFGRFFLEDGDSFHIGYDLIEDIEAEPLVISWQAPVAQLFYQATADDDRGVRLRRHFATQRNTIKSIRDEPLVAGQAGPSYSFDPLLEELERTRSGRLQDVVKTIQAAQDKVMRTEMSGVVVVQGGPGTGKTVIGLQRISVLLFLSQALKAERVLFVGPSIGFINYVQGVLAGIGDANVIQLAVTQLLANRLTPAGTDSPSVARLKARPEMGDLLRRFIESRRNAPEDDAAIVVQGVSLDYTAKEIWDLMADLHDGAAPHMDARGRLRQRLEDLFDRKAAKKERLRSHTMKGEQSLTNLLNRIWPAMSPQEALRDLLSSRARLTDLTKGLFDDSEAAALFRTSQQQLSDEPWTPADIALLDELDWLLNGTPATYDYIVVDEAQDLTPMQWRAVARRASGRDMTLLGDIAQATGPLPPSDWNEVVERIGEVDHKREFTLDKGYRVPIEIMDVAGAVAQAANAGEYVPESYRSDPESLSFTPVRDSLAKAVVEAVASSLRRGWTVGVAVSDGNKEAVGAGLNYEGIEWSPPSAHSRGGAIVGPASALKGFEFDAVVVVEPTDLVHDSGNRQQGLKELYVALTRAVRHVEILFAKELPEPMAAWQPTETGEPEAEPPASGLEEGPMGEVRTETREVGTTNGLTEQVVQASAEFMADQIRSAVSPELWRQVVRHIADELLGAPEDDQSDPDDEDP